MDTPHRFVSIETLEDLQALEPSLTQKGAYISIVEIGKEDLSHPLVMKAYSTMEFCGKSQVSRWPGTALGGTAFRLQFKGSPAFIKFFINDFLGRESSVSFKQSMKKAFGSTDMQIYDFKQNLLAFSVARNGTLAVREDLLTK